MKRPLIGLAVWCCALPALAQPSDADRDRSEELYEKGYRTAVGGDLQGALSLFARAIELDPQNHLAVFDLGGVHEALGDKAQALKRYVATTRLQPTFIEAHNQAGTLYLLHERSYDQAIDHFRRALLVKTPLLDRRFPRKHTISQSLQNLVVCYAQKKMVGVATAVATSYLEDPELDRSRDGALRRLLRLSRAGLERAERREHGAALTPIRRLLYGGKIEEALTRYQAFAKAHSKLLPTDTWDLASGLAMAHALSGDHAQAAAHFRRAVTASRTLAAAKVVESHFNLACALSLQGKLDEALVEIEVVLWLERMTRYPREGRSRKTPKLSSDSTLVKVRQDPRFKKLLATYEP